MEESSFQAFKNIVTDAMLYVCNVLYIFTDRDSFPSILNAYTRTTRGHTAVLKVNTNKNK